MKLAIRERSARVAVLQEVLDGMRQVIAARAFQYADDPVGATGMMVKDYRGKNGEGRFGNLTRPWCRRSTTC